MEAQSLERRGWRRERGGGKRMEEGEVWREEDGGDRAGGGKRMEGTMGWGTLEVGMGFRIFGITDKKGKTGKCTSAKNLHN